MKRKFAHKTIIKVLARIQVSFYSERTARYIKAVERWML